jgi:hypothetical protein
MSGVLSFDPWRESSFQTYERAKAFETASSVLGVAPTGCSPIMMAASDGNVYWVKPQHNPHGQLSLVAERIVAAAAAYLGAPIADSTLLTIPDGWHDSRYPSANNLIHPGTAHASRVVDGTLIEDTELKFVRNDGNSERAPAYVALWEWCWGDDRQWAYNKSLDHQMWTFDHGLWLGGGGEWAIEDLPSSAKLSNGWDGGVNNMDASVFLGLADRLEGCTVADVLEIAASVPIDWGITDRQLIIIAKWLHDRRAMVIQNLKKHAKNV